MSLAPGTLLSQSNTMTLAEVIARLSEKEVVDGLLLIGSTASGLSPASDYDLVVVLSEMPAPLHVAITYIDQRLTDVIFFSVAAVERILSQDDLLEDAGAMAGKLIRWLQTGRIAFDRRGNLERAQRKVHTGQWLKTASAEQIYAAWFSINYNLLQTKRMHAAADPVYATAVSFRLLYSLAELGVSYFHIRRLPWEGEKQAIRYWAANDPAYLALFQQCMAEADQERKLRCYEQLAALTLAPAGGLWEEGATAIQFEVQPGETLSPGLVDAALAFWEGLLSEQGNPQAQ